MSKTLIVGCLILLVVISSSTFAVEVKDLYLVKWPVQEQSKTAEWKAALAGFKEVLVRKSGSDEILNNPQVQQAYRKVTGYLQRFEYSRQTEKNAEFPYFISLYFEPRLIDDIIQKSRFPLWGANRPVTIIWLAVEDESKRTIIDGSEVSNDVFIELEQNATRRGLPIITPLMDLDDELIVSISDIWGRFPSTIKQASQRYAADSILFGRITKDGQHWNGKFGYINQNKETSFEIDSSSKQQVVADMTDKLAEILCSKYCVIEEIGQKNEIFLDVSDINNFQEFKAVEDYLAELSSVAKSEIVKINQYHVLYRLTLLGQVDSLVEGIGLSQKLIEVESDNDVVDAQNDQRKTEQSEPINREFEVDRAIQSLKVKDQQSEPIGNHKVNIEESSNQSSELKTLYYRWIG